jgi:hypothetical protein
MRKTEIRAAAAVLFLLVAAANPFPAALAQSGDASGDRSSVLVELFTSEGCSSCPPADQLLSKLQAEQPISGVQIVGLEEHVDYWNHDGWMDPYSGVEWTARQQEYVARLKGNSPYTPQMIVDGQDSLLGNNAQDAVKAIRQAAQRGKVQVSVVRSSSTGDAERFDVRVGGLSVPGGSEKADVWLAVTEAGLQTSVGAGENSGKSWEHASIVRSLQKIGTTASNSPAPFTANPQIKLKSNWKRENLRVVVFVQERKTWHVLGSATAKVIG